MNDIGNAVMASEPRNYPDYVFVAYDEDFSAQTYDIAVSLEPGNLVGRPVKYIRHDLNTRPAPVDANPLTSNLVDDKITLDTNGNAPAATDTGLETVGYGYVNSLGELEYAHATSSEMRTEALCRRSQAVELLAAKDKTIALAETTMIEMHQDLNKLEAELAAERADKRIWLEKAAIEAERVERLEADNAALTARVKELDKECDDWCASLNQERKSHESAHNRAEALKTDNAAKDARIKVLTDYRKRYMDTLDVLNSELTKKILRIKELEEYGQKIDEAWEKDTESWGEDIEKIKNLEAKLAAAEKALEFYADVSKYPAPFTGGFGALYYDCGQKARAALGGKNTAAEQAGPVPAINAKFETSENGITGIRFVDVKRIEYEDDGSLTVVIDYWPEPARAVLAGK